MINFTAEDLVLYLYKETSDTQTQAIEKALREDWTLREKLQVLKTSLERLDRLIETPRTEIILEILRYAREKTAEQV